MRVIGIDILEKAIKNYPQNDKKRFAAWLEDVERTNWKTSIDVQNTLTNAFPIGKNRIKFYIKGGQYRIVVKVDYARGIVEIRFVGTHPEYDRIDALTI